MFTILSISLNIFFIFSYIGFFNKDVILVFWFICFDLLFEDEDTGYNICSSVSDSFSISASFPAFSFADEYVDPTLLWLFLRKTYFFILLGLNLLLIFEILFSELISMFKVLSVLSVLSVSSLFSSLFNCSSCDNKYLYFSIPSRSVLLYSRMLKEDEWDDSEETTDELVENIPSFDEEEDDLHFLYLWFSS